MDQYRSNTKNKEEINKTVMIHFLEYTFIYPILLWGATVMRVLSYSGTNENSAVNTYNSKIQTQEIKGDEVKSYLQSEA